MKSWSWLRKPPFPQPADLLVVDPGRSQCLLELGQSHDVDVDELHHLVALCRATGLVPHNLPHDPGDEIKSNFK